MTKTLFGLMAAALIAAPLAGYALAGSPVATGTPKLSDEQITEMLAKEGYAVLRIEREHDEIEVDATRDGEQWELELNPETGKIVKKELED